MRHPFRFRPNHADELHCVPSSVGMLLEGLTGESLSEPDLEDLCGFVPGEEVWQFQWMLSLADRGLLIVSVDDFDPDLFIRDPEAELFRGTEDPDVVKRVFEVSDVPAQIPLVEACLEHPEIQLERRMPDFQELDQVLDGDNGILVNLNARALNGKEGYAGHVVLLHRAANRKLILEDPGPPAQPNHEVEEERFLRAWHSPSPLMANYVLVSSTS